MYNNKNIPTEILSKETLLNQVSPYDVYNYYMPGIQIGRVYRSPLRKDVNPSFGIFIGRSGELAFNDYRLGGGDCIKFVALREGLSYSDAMVFISKLFKINLLRLYDSDPISVQHRLKPLITNKKVIKKSKPKIAIQVRDWTDDDREYFSPLNVELIHNTHPINYFWIDQQLFKGGQRAYAYRYGNHIYKIYQPEKDVKEGKWWSNISNDVAWYGHDRLPNEGHRLYVCSSNKDAAVLHQIGEHAIAPHTEAQIFSSKQFEEYSSRFQEIIIFYDNDEAGIKHATKFSTAYTLEHIYLEEVETKDPFEFVKLYSLKELQQWLRN